MTFNDLTFLFLFLPVVLLVYRLVPKILKNPVLILFSLIFYAWGSPVGLVILLFSLCFNYFAGLQLDAVRAVAPGKARLTVWVSVGVNVALLCLYKYYSGLVMPIGLSFYTFTALSYLLDVYRGKTAAQKNVLHFALYLCFFPKLTSGPIVRYEEMEPQLRERKMTKGSMGAGASMFLAGLAKKVLIADALGSVFTQIRALPEMAALTAWLGILCYAFQLYFDFSGYSDMAIGLATMFGFKLGKNFDYPYLSGSIAEFWRRWHISLGAWFREYVYIPLGGNRCSTLRQVGNLLTVWLLTGIWHGSSLNFLLWGLYNGCLLLLEKFLLKNILEKIPRGVRVIPTFLAVLLGWVFFFSNGLGESFGYLGAMLGSGGSFADSTTWYYLGGSWVLLVMAILGSTPFVRSLYGNLVYRSQGFGRVVAVLGCGLVFLCCVAYMVASTYSSFLYFQF